MQKRSEAAKREKVFFRTKLKCTSIVVLCILFALSTIYAVDISTYKLMENENDQYAMRATMESENTVRIDVVGQRYDVDIKNLRSFTDNLAQKTKELITDIKNKLR